MPTAHNSGPRRLLRRARRRALSRLPKLRFLWSADVSFVRLPRRVSARKVVRTPRRLLGSIGLWPEWPAQCVEIGQPRQQQSNGHDGNDDQIFHQRTRAATETLAVALDLGRFFWSRYCEFLKVLWQLDGVYVTTWRTTTNCLWRKSVTSYYCPTLLPLCKNYCDREHELPITTGPCLWPTRYQGRRLLRQYCDSCFVAHSVNVSIIISA